MAHNSFNNTKIDQLLLRVTRAAGMLDMSKSKLYSLINEGLIPAIRVGKSIRIPIDRLNDWIAEQPRITT